MLQCPPWPSHTPPRQKVLSRAARACSTAAAPLRLVHETERLLVVNKPPGLAFHADAGGDGVMQAARSAQASGALHYSGRLFGVHRLDRGTSGLLILAKDAESAGLLGHCLRAGAIAKFYVGLSARRPSKKMGTVSGDMARSRRGAWKLLRSSERPAVTQFVSSGVPGADGRPLRAFALRPRTGRTHQLRVALKALGSPVLGDALYADSAEAALEERMYLHACGLRVPPLAPGEQAVEVALCPDIGAHFAAAPFQAWFAARFPPGAGADAWCADSPLLAAPPPAALHWGGEEDDSLDEYA
jgi:tRNA pseudouridine32 synthase/23S rRNA pseudouridine746 synthase